MAASFGGAMFKSWIKAVHGRLSSRPRDRKGCGANQFLRDPGFKIHTGGGQEESDSYILCWNAKGIGCRQSSRARTCSGSLGAVEQQNLNYVTASDDVPESSQRKPTRTVESSSSSEQMSASEDEDDKILEMLKKAKRAGKGKGIAFEPDLEESKSKGKKYPLLERKKEGQAASSSGLDKVLVQTLKSSELQGQRQTSTP